MATGGKAHNAVVLGVVDVEGDVFVGKSYNKSVGTSNGEVAKQGCGEIALAWLVIGVSRQGAAGQHLDMRPISAIDSAKCLGDGGSQRLCLALRKIFIGLQVDGKGLFVGRERRLGGRPAPGARCAAQGEEDKKEVTPHRRPNK